MKTIGLSTLLGVIIAGILIYIIDFQNPASNILTITICVGMTTWLGSLLGKAIARKKPSTPASGPGDAP